jgi:hypothetical protein
MSRTNAVAFEANLPAGRLRLGLPMPADANGPPDAVDAALLLAQHEPFVLALERWLQAAVVPTLCTANLADHSAGHWVWANADGGVQLGFDWAALQSIDPNALPVHALQWQALVFSVEVAHFERPPWPGSPESGSTAPAAPGVLLLPPSFAPSWRVQLHSTLLSTEAEWDGPGSPLLLSGAPQLREPTAAQAPWAVSMDEPCHFTPPELLGWRESLPVRIPGQASLRGPQQQRWSGRIAPALHGAGLWL